MIIGIGIDIIEADRFKKAALNYAFLEKIFTKEELKMSGDNIVMLADNFAVKEAVSKAFGTGIRKMALKDIEVLRDELGKPYVNLYGPALAKYEELKGVNLQVSITNTRDNSAAICVIEG